MGINQDYLTLFLKLDRIRVMLTESLPARIQILLKDTLLVLQAFFLCQKLLFFI